MIRLQSKHPKSAVQQYRLNLQTVCDIGRNLGAHVVLCKQARLAVQDLSTEERNRVPYEFTGLAHDELIRAFATCDEVIEQVAEQKDCRVVDMHEPLSGRPEYFADHIHFTPEGCEVAARLVAAQLAGVIVEPPSSSLRTTP